ncbi:glycosyltransferase family 4 protein [uncultured Photobacterium sp.]|uniref:glycosyltransferase family 4 protein n=1 Tax=uncultured Photobacterium sp. TaxID=173973 RepID=UPI002625A263|nr:glycosyltransferase family 4 protein [uncultured Photobacterium sp.]
MIYLFIDSSGFGGIESHIHQLALLIQSRDVEVEVVYLQRCPGHPQYERLTESQIPFRFLSDSSSHRFFCSLSKDDVVHAHGYKASIMARLFRLFAPYRLITTFHAGESLTGRLAVYEWLNAYTGFLSYNLAVSSPILERQPFSCELLRNFVLSELPLPIRSRHSTLQVGFVGRLSHEKGIDRFLRLSESHADYHFHVFGDGELAPLVRGKSTLSWHGSVSSMTSYWQHLDVLVISSRAEGLPMVALEAMANGVLVLATDVGDLACLLPADCLVKESQWRRLSRLLKRLENFTHDEWCSLSCQLQSKIMTQFSGDSRWPQLTRVYQLTSSECQ